MLEKRDDLALLWDLRVAEEYKHQGIGQMLFNMAKSYAIKKGFKQFKVECQNTNSLFFSLCLFISIKLVSILILVNHI